MFVLLRIEDSKVVSDVYWEFDEEGAAAAGEEDVVVLGVSELAPAAVTVSVEVW